MESYNETAQNRAIQELAAMETPEKWLAYRKEQLTPILGILDEEKSAPIAEFLNKRFMDAALACGAMQIKDKWKTLPDTEKIAFAQNIVNTLVDLLTQDIQNDRLTLYNGRGEVYQPSNPQIANVYKNEILKYIRNDLKITALPYNKGLMAISATGKLIINLKWGLYKSIDFFLRDLRHEMMHMVDILIPQISPMDPEVRGKAIRYYVSCYESGPEDFYKKNPLELHANFKQVEFMVLCGETLQTLSTNRLQKLKQKIAVR